jgi:alpha/beta superfamily hydrolase
MNITVLCFDFQGSGLSQGKYISLGVFERDDVALIIEYLRNSEKVTCIGLWGRSMGACTALLHGDRDPSIAGMILDSPFASLKVLAKELATQRAGNVPSFVLSGILSFVRKTIKKKAFFDINDLVPINHV